MILGIGLKLASALILGVALFRQKGVLGQIVYWFMWGDFGEGVRFRSKLLDWFLFVLCSAGGLGNLFKLWGGVRYK